MISIGYPILFIKRDLMSVSAVPLIIIYFFKCLFFKDEGIKVKERVLNQLSQECKLKIRIYENKIVLI